MRTIIVIYMLLVCGVCYAQFAPLYGEGFVVTKLIKVDDSLRLDLPFEITSQEVVCESIQFHGDSIPLSYEGKECLSHITYHSKDELDVQKFKGFIKDKEDVLKSADYKKHYDKTMKDVKGSVEEPYIGTDKDEPAPFCVFLEKEYQDK